MILQVQYLTGGDNVIPDGTYEAKIFPNAALFRVYNPIVPCWDSRVALLYNGSMNVDKVNGTNGQVIIKDGVTTCSW